MRVFPALYMEAEISPKTLNFPAFGALTRYYKTSALVFLRELQIMYGFV